MHNWLVVVVSLVCLVAVLAALAVIYARMLPASRWTWSLGVSAAVAGGGAAVWLVGAPALAPGLTTDLYLPVAALAAVATLLATLAVRSMGANLAVAVVFAVLWAAVVFLPVALVSLAGIGLAGLSPIDHGGALAVNVAAGSAALGTLLAAGPKAPRPRTGALPFSLGLVAVVGLSVGWVGWLAAAELAIDDATSSIVVNGLVGAVGGIAGWLAVQRILHQSTTLPAVAAGLMSGLVSVAAGANLFTPVSAAAAGVISGAAAAHFTIRRVGASRRPQWFIVGSHLVAGSLGVVLLGLLATDTGFLFTGQISFIQNQIVTTLAVALYSAVVSFVLWVALKRLPLARRSTVIPVRRVPDAPGA